MSQPTISLALIAKNEEKNVARLLNSVEGCFDEIIFVDTGSTDNTKTEAQKFKNVKIYDFSWVNSFSAARNFAFSKATCDYVMWLDLDDVLSDKTAFIHWKTYAMEFADMFFATYHYALDKDGKPIVSFVRERVFKRSLDPVWRYDLHEGITPKPEWTKDYAITWSVLHMRDAQDVSQDKSRNISLLEEIKTKKGLDSRLQFYYGKELYESGRPSEAIIAFDEAITHSDLEPHDRLLSYQYAAYSCVQFSDQLKDELRQEKDKYLSKAIDYCLKGISIDPNRAEFHVTCGDVYLKKMDLVKAIPHYSAAKKCVSPKDLGSPYEGALYSFVDCYGLNPTLNLAKIYFNIGKLDLAEQETLEAIHKYNSDEGKQILEEILKFKTLSTIENNQVQTEDIVFSCPPQTAYPFDEELYKTKGMGGSETALIEVARWLKLLTNRRVIVFNMRDSDLVTSSGVEYISNQKLPEYFSKFRPKVHVAWRHNMELTKAKTYLWCHDLVTATVESRHNFDKIMCLTEFHKNYVMAKQGVPSDKIIITRNGIDPVKFSGFDRKDKNPNKLVWMSSPDRGLDRAMMVCDEVKKEFPDIELHVYYGLENLYKYGMADLAEHLKKMMAERPYVKYHGFTEQALMYEQVSDAVCWVHPCNFIETFCITALEMLELGIYPVTRRLGALQNTLKDAEEKDMAVMLDHDCITPTQVTAYANEVTKVLRNKKWEKIKFNKDNHSWKSVASEWSNFMEL